ncbi:MAG: sugar transferase [Caldilineales bacterium]
MKLDTATGKRGIAAERRRFAVPRLRLRTSERKIVLWLVDVAIINAALAIAWLLAAESGFTLQNITSPYKWYLTLTLVWCINAFVFDLYNLARSASTTNIVRNVTLAGTSTVLIYTLIPWFTPPLQSRVLLFVFAGLVLGGLILWRTMYAQVFIQPQFRQRALIVGAGWAGRTLVNALSNVKDDANPFRGTGYELVGFIDDDRTLAGAEIEGVQVLGGREVLAPMAAALNIDEVILAITQRHAIADDLFDELLRCREQGIHVTSMSSVYENLTGRVPVQHVGRDLYLALPSGDRPSERVYFGVKRLIDIAMALLGLVVLGIVAIGVVIANRLKSPGPLFYRQERVGKAGRSFWVYKFRSMIPDAEARTGAVWAAANDDRITPVGRFLRKTRLDELPQFINVLKGEMSVIGPRPERPEFVETLAETIPFYRARHAVRPGITGWAQVGYRYGSSEDDAHQAGVRSVLRQSHEPAAGYPYPPANHPGYVRT